MKKVSNAMMAYGIGFIGQGTIYCFISTYFVVFMTNCVGVSSSKAGFIMSLAMYVEMFAGMVVGNMSDRCTSKMGKRRPFVLLATIGIPIVTAMLFQTVSLNENGLMAYYLVLSILFRILFSSFEIPYSAFGAEIVRTYDERIRLRTLTRWFSIAGNCFAYVLPLWILEWFGADIQGGWSCIGFTIAGVCFVSWLFAFIATKNYSVVADKSEIPPKAKGNVFGSIVKNYIELFRLKTMRRLMVYKAAFMMAYGLYNVGMIYYLKYCVHLGNKYSSYVYIFSIIIYLILTPVVNAMALKIGKENQQMITLLFAAVSCTFVYFCGRSTLWGTVIYILTFATMQTSFWQLSLSIFYDQVEVDEFVHGKRREGDIVSLVSVLGTIVSAIIVQVFGIGLDLAGFDAELAIQSATTAGFLEVACILVPAVCFFIGWLALFRFPINKTSFDALTKAVECKRNGESYDAYMDEVNKIFK